MNLHLKYTTNFLFVLQFISNVCCSDQQLVSESLTDDGGVLPFVASSSLNVPDAKVYMTSKSLEEAIKNGHDYKVIKEMNSNEFQPEPSYINKLMMRSMTMKRYTTAQFIAQHAKFKIASNTLEVLFEAIYEKLEYVVGAIIAKPEFRSLVIEVDEDAVKSLTAIELLPYFLRTAILQHAVKICHIILDFGPLKLDKTQYFLLNHAIVQDLFGIFAKIFRREDFQPTPGLLNDLLNTSISKPQVFNYTHIIMSHPNFKITLKTPWVLMRAVLMGNVHVVSAIMNLKECQLDCEVFDNLLQSSFNLSTGSYLCKRAVTEVIVQHEQFKKTDRFSEFLHSAMRLGYLLVSTKLLSFNTEEHSAKYFNDLLHFSLEFCPPNISKMIVQHPKFEPGSQLNKFIERALVQHDYAAIISLMNLNSFRQDNEFFDHLIDIAKEHNCELLVIVKHPNFITTERYENLDPNDITEHLTTKEVHLLELIQQEYDPKTLGYLYECAKKNGHIRLVKTIEKNPLYKLEAGAFIPCQVS